MPFMKKVNGKSVRDYQAEKAWDHRHDGGKRIKDRAKRNAARATVAKEKGTTPTAMVGDVGHKKAVSKGGKNGLRNLFLQNAGENRSFKRNSKGAMISEVSDREKKKKK